MEITHNAKRLLLVVVLVAATVFFRLYRIADVPLGINNDAAWEGSAARSILQGNWKDFVPYAAQWHGEPIIRLTVVALTPLIGNTTTTIKTASALWGILLIPLLYIFLRKLYPRTISFLAAWLVATSGWHIVMSRSGWRAITVPTVTTLIFLCIYLAITTKRRWWFVASGAATALILYTYDAGRIIPVVVCAGLGAALLFRRSFRKKYRSSMLIFVACFLFCSAPMIIYGMTNWNILIGRTTYLLVTQQMAHTHSLTPLIQNIIATAGLFVWRGNGNDFFINNPLLDPPALFLFPFSFVIVIVEAIRHKDRRLWFMLGWFFVSLLPAILSTPNGNRAIGAIPTVYFFIAYGIIVMIQWISHPAKENKKTVELFFILYFITISAIATYMTYLGSNRRQPDGFHPETFVVANFLKTQQSSSDIYLTDNFPREILTYILYQNGDPFRTSYTWYAKRDFMMTTPINPKRNTIFVLAPILENERFTDQLMNRYPSAIRYYAPYTSDAFRDAAALIVEIPKQ